MADTFTLQVEAGATFDSISFEYLEDDEITPVPMTGWTAKLQIRETAEAELTLEVIPTITVATGLIEFAFTPTQTSLLTLPFDQHYHLSLPKSLLFKSSLLNWLRNFTIVIHDVFHPSMMEH